MLNGQLKHDLALPPEYIRHDYIQQQIKQLLETCNCQLINSKDYQLEAGAQAVNGLVAEHETADVYLYAAIERQDWAEVTRLYQLVFRPYLYQAAREAIVGITDLPY